MCEPFLHHLCTTVTNLSLPTQTNSVLNFSENPIISIEIFTGFDVFIVAETAGQLVDLLL
jgi:hypothetical protein